MVFILAYYGIGLVTCLVMFHYGYYEKTLAIALIQQQKVSRNVILMRFIASTLIGWPIVWCALLIDAITERF